MEEREPPYLESRCNIPTSTYAQETEGVYTDLSHQTFGQKCGSTSNALGLDSKRGTLKRRRTRHYRYPWKRTKRRQPPRSGSDEGPTDPEGLRALRGNGRSNRRLGIRGGTSAKGKKKTPSARAPYISPRCQPVVPVLKAVVPLL